MKKPARKTVSPPAAPSAAKVASKKSDAGNAEHLSLDEIKALIELISEKQFNEFELERGDFRLRLQKGVSKASSETHVSNHSSEQGRFITVSAEPNVSPVPIASPAPTAPPPEDDLQMVASPIVGTFYRSSSPTAEAFVKVGDAVESGQTLCIIEAMKLMNEIPSEVRGIVAKIYVENGQPVEYGQAVVWTESLVALMFWLLVVGYVKQSTHNQFEP